MIVQDTKIEDFKAKALDCYCKKKHSNMVTSLREIKTTKKQTSHLIPCLKAPITVNHSLDYNFKIIMDGVEVYARNGKREKRSP